LGAAFGGGFAAPPESLYRVGMVVRVQGVVSWYQGDPQILVHDPAQVVALADE
jgi:DNA/RNA endonuclease YhcR with UshA esterase domain